MRKAALYGLALVCVCLLFALSGPEAQRIAPSPNASASRPTQVEVTNFPTVQPVNGTVNVANLPLDQNGSVRVSVPEATGAPPLRFVGFTVALVNVEDVGQVLRASRACAAEFPRARICTSGEMATLVPIPPDPAPAPFAWVIANNSLFSEAVIQLICTGQERTSSFCAGPNPVACCGY
jgi:hypothetical protein